MLLNSWVRQVWYWMAEIPTFWTCVAVLGVVTAGCLSSTKVPDDGLRYAGLLLQLLGVGVVAYTLRGRGKLFGKEPVLTFAVGWLRRAPRFRPRHIILEASGSSQANASASAEATVWRGPRLEQSLEAQLDAIRENMATLRQQLERAEYRSSQKVAELYNAIESERAQRSSQLQETKKTLEILATDSLYLEVAGLAWLVVGIVLATVPQELAKAILQVVH